LSVCCSLVQVAVAVQGVAQSASAATSKEKVQVCCMSLIFVRDRYEIFTEPGASQRLGQLGKRHGKGRFAALFPG